MSLRKWSNKMKRQLIFRRFWYIGVVLFLVAAISGCAGVQRKFVRKKKTEEKPMPIVTAYDYAKELRADELYKKYFMFWKSWQGELIEKIGSRYKKRNVCYEKLMDSLMEMKKYLDAKKAKELEVFIEEIKTIEPAIKKDRLTRNEEYNVQQLLEKTKRQIEKDFSYSDVKENLFFKQGL